VGNKAACHSNKRSRVIGALQLAVASSTISTTPSAWRSTGARAPMSTPSRRAIEERTDATSSCSPSISLVLMTSSVNTDRLAWSRRAIPTSASRPINRPWARLTSASGWASAARSKRHVGQSPACQMYVKSPLFMRRLWAAFSARASHSPHRMRRMSARFTARDHCESGRSPAEQVSLGALLGTARASSAPERGSTVGAAQASTGTRAGAKFRCVSAAVGDNAPAAGFAGVAAARCRRHAVTGPGRQTIPPPLELQWTH